MAMVDVVYWLPTGRLNGSWLRLISLVQRIIIIITHPRQVMLPLDHSESESASIQK